MITAATSKRNRKHERKLSAHREELRRWQDRQAYADDLALALKRRYQRLMYVAGMLIDELVWRETRTGEDTTRIVMRLERSKQKLNRYHQSQEVLLSFTNLVSWNLRRLREVKHG